MNIGLKQQPYRHPLQEYHWPHYFFFIVKAGYFIWKTITLHYTASEITPSFQMLLPISCNSIQHVYNYIPDCSNTYQTLFALNKHIQKIHHPYLAHHPKGSSPPDDVVRASEEEEKWSLKNYLFKRRWWWWWEAWSKWWSVEPYHGLIYISTWQYQQLPHCVSRQVWKEAFG